MSGSPSMEISLGRTERSLVNLVANGEFETDVSGWSAWQSTAVRSVAQAKLGVASLLSTIQDGKTASSAAYPIAVSGSTAGRVYSARLWVFGEGTLIGKTVRLVIREDGGAAGFGDTNTDTILAAGWQKMIGSRTIVEDDRTEISVHLGIPSGGQNGDHFYLDSVWLILLTATFSSPRASTEVQLARLNGQNRGVSAEFSAAQLAGGFKRLGLERSMSELVGLKHVSKEYAAKLYRQQSLIP